MKVKSESRTVRVKNANISMTKDYPWLVLSHLLDDLADFLPDSDVKMVRGIIRNRDLPRYFSLNGIWALQSTHPDDISPEEFKAKYQLVNVLKKFQWDTDSEARKQTSVKKFISAEESCKHFNSQGYLYFLDEDPLCVAILYHARDFLRRLFGPLPGSRALLQRARHGPGATLDTQHGFISSYNKYREWPYSCTIDALRYARFAIASDQRWFGALISSYRERENIPQYYPIKMERFWAKVIKIVDGNRIAFVPKDAHTERTIAIEPTLNLYLQLGVDGYLRKRLRRFGIDLNSQEKNQRMARLGSKTLPDSDENYVTIDLSAASDSISTKLVEMLLPPEWCDYLMALRSPKGTLESDVISYEKISSMGNGYTFVLESAIFAALIHAAKVVDKASRGFEDAAVYGDDLIVRRKHFETLEIALCLAGFTINRDKSFYNGSFRESCGSDWFNGIAVRPVFVKEYPQTIRDIFSNHNRFKRSLELRYGMTESSTAALHLRWIPSQFQRCVGPFSDEDFDSYRHVPEPTFGSWRRFLYHYQRVIVSPKPHAGDDFLFRKLMHRLEEAVEQPDQYSQEVYSEGSRFVIFRRNRLKTSITYSVSEIWRSSYTEYLP
jgi:hypothetical protein